MSIPQKGDILVIPAYTAENEQASQEISWSQSFRTRTARYYIVKAQNQSQGNANVLVYIQDSFYKNETATEFIGKLPGAKKAGSKYRHHQHWELELTSTSDSWLVTISDSFQYGQKNKNGEGRWVALHDKNNKPYQVSIRAGT